MSRLPSRHFLREAALDAARRGWRVFPLQPGGTDPAIQDWQHRATSDPERIIRAWKYGPYNVALAPCTSGLLALDLLAARPGQSPPRHAQGRGVHDGADVLAVLTEQAHARFPADTYTVTHPDGGFSLIFTHPAGPCPQASPAEATDSLLGWHVCIRSANSYVLLAGSTTSKGSYTLAHAAPLPAPWPGYLADHLAGSPVSAHCHQSGPAGQPTLPGHSP
ncbi:bifunctional DNA primase/polymerase [Streptomyces sp. NPDC001941]|uniref:bifunctional DNA primase/polymerase n=1 Tax=Streptomyces sp. NPDC001941 TaxID=3154659 RepID=UPI00332DBFF0